jgi:hypothetical protein
MKANEFGSFRHLASRFFGALSPAGPARGDDAWAERQLLAGERQLWRRMSGPDRRHAVGVARDAIVLLDGEPPAREVVAAALMHDVGKIEAGYGTFARVGITLAAMATGRRRLVRWAGPVETGAAPGWRGRVGLYLTHDRVGAELLTAAGSDGLTVAWAGEHHQPEESWTVERSIGRVLKEADGD